MKNDYFLSINLDLVFGCFVDVSSFFNKTKSQFKETRKKQKKKVEISVFPSPPIFSLIKSRLASTYTHTHIHNKDLCYLTLNKEKGEKDFKKHIA